MELLLKAILEKEHWSLLFENSKDASRKVLAQGAFESVRFETALDRVQNIVEITIQPKDLKYLRRLRTLRNQLHHFTTKLNVDQAKSLVARGISLFFTLQQRYLHPSPDKTLEHEVNRTLKAFEKYVRERLRSLQSELESSKRPPEWFRSCPSCLQDTIVFQRENIQCLFCGDSITLQDLAANSSEARGGPCPVCDDGELALILFNNEEGKFFCVKCGFATDRNMNTECDRCGQEFWNDGGSPFCDGCLSQV